MTDSWTDSSGDDPASRNVRKAVGVGSVVGILIAAAVLLFATGKVGPAKETFGYDPLGSDYGSDSFQTGQAFLSDWQSGNLKAAANITDDPSAALAALTQYQNGLKLSGLTVYPGEVNSVGYMTFSIAAQAGTPAAPWNYASGLAIYEGTNAQQDNWFVKWSPSILFSSLTAGEKLTLGAIPATADVVTDSSGAQLTASNSPSLANIISSIEKIAPVSSGSTPGQEVQIENAAGKVVANVSKISDPLNVASVKTTISLPVQQAAEHAVKRAPNSSMVVIQPSTGDILAIANNVGNGRDNALLGTEAPGSTFKTVTSTMLLNQGTISSVNEVVNCPVTLTVDGLTLHNSEGDGGEATYSSQFAQSCNNAFSNFWNQVTGTELINTAQQYFAFNTPWNIGLNDPTVYGKVPASSGSLLAEQMVGQGNVIANPLAMASVAATIATGTFKQPILLPGTTQVSATALPGNTDSQLQSMMRAVITSGTLASVYGGEAGVFGKTGTAEVQGQVPNSWTIAYKGDYAVCALAIAGNFGASTAGPETKSLLDSVG